MTWLGRQRRRELGSALGVAIIGSIVSHLYRSNVHDQLTGQVPAEIVDVTGQGIGVTRPGRDLRVASVASRLERHSTTPVL